MPLDFRPDVTPQPAEGINTSAALRPSDVTFDEVTGMPYQAWAPAPSEGFLALGSRSDYASVAAGTQSGGLTPAGFISDTLTRAEEDPAFNLQMQGAALAPGGWGFQYAKNLFQGLIGEDQDLYDFMPDATFGADEAEKYIQGKFQSNPEFYNNLYSPEMLAEMRGSKSKDEVDFKIRRYGRMLAAEDTIRQYDSDSNLLTYTSAKFISAGMNYVGQDPALIPSIVAGGAILHGAKALAGTSRLLNAGLAGVAGAAEGGGYTYLYERNNANLSQQLGNEDATIDNTAIGWGFGLGAIAGMTMGAFVKNPRIAEALADEVTGAPAANLRRQGMANLDDLDTALSADAKWNTRARAAFKAVGADLSRYTGWATGESGNLKFSPFRSADEVLDWVESAKPSAAELDQLDDAVTKLAAQAADPNSNVKAGSIKLADTEFQKTGVAPAPENAAKQEFSSKLAENVGTMNGTTAVGVLSQLPGAAPLGKVLNGIGTFGVRSGGALRSSVGSVAYATQKLMEVGMRGGDQSVIRLASNSVEAARRTTQRFFGAELGLIRILADAAPLIEKATGQNIVSSMVDTMYGGAKTTGAKWADQFAARFKEGIDTLGRRAQAAGLIEKAEDYFPILFNTGAIRENAEAFSGDLFKYLKTTFNKKGADLNRIHLRQIEWIDNSGNVTDLGAQMGLKSGDELLDSLDDAAREAYLNGLDDSLRLQANRTGETIEGGLELESLLINPDSVDAVVATGRSVRANSAKAQTFSKDIYLDGDMKRWMNQDPSKLYGQVTNSLAVRTEFALSQVDELGKATHFEDMIDELKSLVQNDKSLAARERTLAAEALDSVETEFRYALGLQPKAGSAFDTRLAAGVVDSAVGAGRATVGSLWGIPVASMELPQAMAVSGGAQEASKNLGSFLKAIKPWGRADQWALLAAFGEATDHLRLNTRGVLEDAAHEGMFLGLGTKQRFKQPWVNVIDGLKATADDKGSRSMATRIASTIPNTLQAFGATMTSLGGMPVLSEAGRIMVGRFGERQVATSIGRMLKFQQAVADKTLSPQQFKALAKRMGFKSNDAELLNRAGMMDPKVLKYIDDAVKGGHWNKKNLDYEGLYRWAQKNGRLEDHRAMSRAMSTYTTERMNSAFATPSIASRVGTNERNPLMAAMTTFWSFPAAFYQQRLMMAGGDSSYRGVALAGSYMGLEVLHRSLRDLADPRQDTFGDLDAVASKWTDNPTQMFYRSISGGLPMTGMYPLGRAAESLIFGGDFKTNYAEGQLNSILGGINSALPSNADRPAQRSGEWLETLRSIESTR